MTVLMGGLDAVVWEGIADLPVTPTASDQLPWRWVFVSSHAERWLGYGSVCWYDDPAFWPSRIHPEDRDWVLDAYRGALMRGGSLQCNYRIFDARGGLVWVRDVLRIEDHRDGRRRKLRGVLLDVTDWKGTEQALRESEERYRDLVENINECIFVVGQDGRIDYISPVIEKISGFRVSEALRRSFVEFVHPDDLGLLAASFQRAIGGEAEPLEYRLLTKTGEPRWVRSWSRPILSGDQISGVRGVLVDITKRKEAEEALRESEERYRNLFESANELIFTFDVGARLTSVNATAEEVTGYSRDELLKMNLEVLTAPEELDFVRRMVANTLAGQRTTYETQIVTKDGRRVPLEVSSRAILRHAKVVGMLGVARDLSERDRARALATERNRLEEETHTAEALAQVGRALIACRNLPLLAERLCQLTAEILTCDCSHSFTLDPEEQVYVAVGGYGDTPEDAEAIRALRIPRSVLGGLLDRLTEQDVVQVVLSEPQDLLPAAFPARFGMTVVLFMALRRDGEIVGLHSACYRGREQPFDVQQMRIARGMAQLASLAVGNAQLVGELERANRLKSDFMATMSHELRTPLNVILGYSDLLLSESFGPLTSAQVETTERMQKSALGLLDLVDATLAVGRIETGRLPLDCRELHLGDFFAEVKDEAYAWRDKGGVDLQWEVPAGLPALHSDRTKLKVIVKNLIANAVKFTAAGKVRVGVRSVVGGIEITVEDTGIGMTPEVQQLIFEPFRQGDATIGERYGGVGLGLYIVQRLLDILGGRIHVQSEPGKGSTFRVWLPLEHGSARTVES